jgi:hypothetical protein
MKLKRDVVTNHLRYSWVTYVGIVLASAAVWVIVFSAMLRTKDYQKLSVFLCEVAIDEPGMEQSLQSLLEKTGRRLDYVDVEPADIASGEFMNILAMRAVAETDFIILPESMIRFNTGSTYFAPMDKSIAEKYFGPDTRYYEEDGKVYAVILGGDGSGSNFSKYLDAGVTQDYYLFFSSASANTAGMDHSKPQNDFAMLAAAWLSAQQEG